MADLDPAATRLLRIIAEADTGDGVVFRPLSRSRWQRPGSGYTVDGRAFWPLELAGLIVLDEGDGPVRITQAGRVAAGTEGS